MRTLLIVLIGFALWAACLWVANLVGKSGSSMTAATAIFVAIWFVAAALNMWIGISHARLFVPGGTADLPVDIPAARRRSGVRELEVF